MGGSRPVPGTLVGREQELAALDAAVVRALDGRGDVCLVAGPAGIGKTHLLTELSERLAARGVAVGWGRAWDGEGAPAFWPWAQAVRSLLRAGPNDVADVEAGSFASGGRHSYLAQAMPELAPVLDAGPPDLPVASAGTRFLVFDAVVEALTAASSAGPAVVVLDDLHAVDLASVQLLEFVASEIRRLSIAIVGAARAQDPLVDPTVAAGPVWSSLDRLGAVALLQGLSGDDVGRLVEQHTGAPTEPDLARRVHRLTEGNPFFVGEIVRLLAGGQADWRRSGAVPLPASLRSLVQDRVTALDATTRSVLEVASVLGEEFAVAPLAIATRSDRSTVLHALDVASGAGLLRESAVVGSFRFVHALTRESLYADLGAVRRLELHAEVGRALEQAYAGHEAEHAVELAEHFGRAAALGDPRPAVRYARQAAASAAGAFAYDDAARAYAMAVDALALAGADPEERASNLLDLAEAQTRGTGCDAAVAVFDDAAALAAAAGRADLLGRAAVGATRAHFRLAGYVLDLDARLRVLEQAASATAGRGDPLEAMVLSSLAWTRSVSSTDVDAIGLADRAVALAEQMADAEAVALAHHARRWALEGPGRPEEKRSATATVLRIADDRDLELRWWGHRWALLDALEACDAEHVHEELAQVAHLSARLREPYFATFVTLFRAAVALLEGRFDDADELSSSAESQAQRSRVGPEHIAGLRLFLARERGRLDMASVAPFLDAYPDVPVFQGLAAWGHANTGDLDAARRALRRLDGPLRCLPRLGHWLATLALAAEAAYRCGDVGTATTIAPLLLEAGDRGVVIGGPLLWTGSAAHYAGLALLTAGDEGAGRQQLLSGRAAHRRLGALPLVASSDAALVAAGMTADRSDRPARSLRFTRVGEVWEIGRPEAPVLVRNSLGLAYLRALLDAPGRERHVLDLVGSSSGPAHPEVPQVVFDDQARAAYQARYDELNDELAEAEAWSDGERTSRARAELEALGAELARGVGLGGRSRVTGSAAERARVNATRAIRSAIDRIGDLDADLAGLLRAGITTGTFCRYDPVPGAPTWT